MLVIKQEFIDLGVHEKIIVPVPVLQEEPRECNTSISWRGIAMYEEGRRTIYRLCWLDRHYEPDGVIWSPCGPSAISRSNGRIECNEAALWLERHNLRWMKEHDITNDAFPPNTEIISFSSSKGIRIGDNLSHEYKPNLPRSLAPSDVLHYGWFDMSLLENYDRSLLKDIEEYL